MKIHREIERLAEAEGIDDVRFEHCKRSSHHWMIGKVDGKEIKMICAITKGSDPRWVAKTKGNIRQAIRRVERGEAFA